MTKYYVKSGVFQRVISAADAYAAVLWTIHLSATVRLLSDPVTGESCLHDEYELLGSEICVSEIGFGRSEVGQWITEEVLADWNRMVIASEKLRGASEQDNAGGLGLGLPTFLSEKRPIPVATVAETVGAGANRQGVVS